MRLSFKEVDMARFKAAFKASVEEMINAGPEAIAGGSPTAEVDYLEGGKKSIKTVAGAKLLRSFKTDSLLSGEPHIRKEDEKKIIDMTAYKVHFE